MRKIESVVTEQRFIKVSTSHGSSSASWMGGSGQCSAVVPAASKQCCFWIVSAERVRTCFVVENSGSFELLKS